MSAEPTIIDGAQMQAWAREGGALARSLVGHLAVQRKPDHSLVTQADTEVEALLRARIATHYPDHGIVGEEQGGSATDQPYVWAIDPIDGTDALVAGLPIWGVSLGLLRHGQPYLGVVYLPLTDDCFWNTPQGGAFWNDTPIQVAQHTRYSAQDWITTTSRAHVHYAISFPGKARSLGSLAAHCCYVAGGSAHGALLGYPRLWDIAAGLAILAAAGGVAHTLDGQPLDTRTLLDGSTPHLPLCVAPAALAAELRTYIVPMGS